MVWLLECAQLCGWWNVRNGVVGEMCAVVWLVECAQWCGWWNVRSGVVGGMCSGVVGGMCTVICKKDRSRAPNCSKEKVTSTASEL